MKHTTYTGVNLSELNISNEGYLSDALKGYWVRKWENNIKLTVMKGHAFLTSEVVDKDTVINIELPEHKPFYAVIIGADTIKRVLVKSNLSTIIHEGEQIQAVFTVEM